MASILKPKSFKRKLTGKKPNRANKNTPFPITSHPNTSLKINRDSFSDNLKESSSYSLPADASLLESHSEEFLSRDLSNDLGNDLGKEWSNDDQILRCFKSNVCQLRLVESKPELELTQSDLDLNKDLSKAKDHINQAINLLANHEGMASHLAWLLEESLALVNEPFINEPLIN